MKKCLFLLGFCLCFAVQPAFATAYHYSIGPDVGDTQGTLSDMFTNVLSYQGSWASSAPLGFDITEGTLVIDDQSNTISFNFFMELSYGQLYYDPTAEPFDEELVLGTGERALLQVTQRGGITFDAQSGEFDVHATDGLSAALWQFESGHSLSLNLYNGITPSPVGPPLSIVYKDGILNATFSQGAGNSPFTIDNTRIKVELNQVATSEVPEPASFGLLLMALAGSGLVRKKGTLQIASNRAND